MTLVGTARCLDLSRLVFCSVRPLAFVFVAGDAVLCRTCFVALSAQQGLFVCMGSAAMALPNAIYYALYVISLLSIAHTLVTVIRC